MKIACYVFIIGTNLLFGLCGCILYQTKQNTNCAIKFLVTSCSFATILRKLKQNVLVHSTKLEQMN